MEKDESSAAFDAMRTEGLKSFFGSEQILKRKALRRELFSFVTWPLAETSIEKKWTIWVCDRSAIRGAYFSDLKLWLLTMFVSHGQVNLKTKTSSDR